MLRSTDVTVSTGVQPAHGRVPAPERIVARQPGDDRVPLGCCEVMGGAPPSPALEKLLKSLWGRWRSNCDVDQEALREGLSRRWLQLVGQFVELTDEGMDVAFFMYPREGSTPEVAR